MIHTTARGTHIKSWATAGTITAAMREWLLVREEATEG
jgi:hypothetical protein